ncbi:MAG: hypothetical protein ILP09_08105, partial [Oscillospiraceae bacterium]|nr:hypothetical protein [Oscillospiraceae bacterium]
MKQIPRKIMSLLLAFTMLFGCMIFASATGAEPFDYDGSAVTFIKDDGSAFGMFAAQDGTACVINGSNVVIHYVPKNKTTYGALHFGDIADAELTADVTFNADGSFDITLPKDANCGKAIPVAPIKVSDGGTTSTQYYLAVPAADKLKSVFGFTLQVGQYTEGADFHIASFDGVVYALKDDTEAIIHPSSGSTGMLRYSGLDASKTYTFTASKEDWAVVVQGEWNTAAHAYEYTFTGEDEISVTITSADADKNITGATHPGMIFRKKPRPANAVDLALELVPADLSIFTTASAEAVSQAAAAADPESTDTDALASMAEAVNNAVKGLVPKDGTYMSSFTHPSGGMFKIIDIVSLDVENGNMSLHFINGSQTYTKLYIGTVDEALAADGSSYILPGDEATASNDKAGYNWVVPVSALQTEIPLAAYSKSKSTFNSTGNFLIPAASLTPVSSGSEAVELSITNNTSMFKAVSASLSSGAEGTFLTVALSGTGYHNLFKGTYEQAVANGDNRDNWIVGANNAEGKPEFRIPVAAGETYIPVVAISDSYLSKYEQGYNSLQRAFYPRQFVVNAEEKTLVTGDYEHAASLTLTNGSQLLNVSSAALSVTGGPNSNNYKADLELTVGGEEFDKAFVGASADITAESVLIDPVSGVFSLPVKWVAEFGKPETLVNLLDSDFTVSFRNAQSTLWSDHTFSVNESAASIAINDASSEAPALTPFDYPGSDVAFISAEGAAFGMFAAQEGTTCVINGDNVVIHFFPKNKSVYGALHFGAITDPALTSDVAFNDDGSFDITLPKASACGKAAPVAPVKKSDGGTTSTQYYLAVPAASLLQDVTPSVQTSFDYTGSDVAFISAEGAAFGMFAAQEGTTCVING